MRRIMTWFVFLMCFFSCASAVEEVTYKEYLRSSNAYSNVDIVINCIVDRVDTQLFDEFELTTIYAYEEKHENMFCIRLKDFDEYYWYELEDAYVGMMPEAYDIIPEGARMALIPRRSIEKVLKGDKISVIGSGYGFTNENNPQIIGVMISIFD